MMIARLFSSIVLLAVLLGTDAFVSDLRLSTNVHFSFAPSLALEVRKDAREPENNNNKYDNNNNIIRSNITLENDITLEFKVHSSIAAIPLEAWNACLPTTKQDRLGSAFLDYSWLHCLEESKCASPQTGWVPQHVSITLNGETKGFIPLYIKGHSSKYCYYCSVMLSVEPVLQNTSFSFGSFRSR